MYKNLSLTSVDIFSLFYCLFIYSYVYALFGPSLPPNPHRPCLFSVYLHANMNPGRKDLKRLLFQSRVGPLVGMKWLIALDEAH
jgi:hypothetical protein